MPPFKDRLATLLAIVASLLTLQTSKYARSEAKRGSAGAADRMAYTSFRPGQWDIYLFQHRNQAPLKLSSGAGLHYDPVVSPDGRWLVFTSEQRGSPDLYAMDLKKVGSVPHLLIESDSMEDQAAFSPDGRTIAFVSTLGGNTDIYVAPFRPESTLHMSSAINLTLHRGGNFRPAFSPDGTKLAFSSNRDSPVNATRPTGRIRDGDIYTIDLHTKSIHRLTSSPGWDGSPSWSPDGKQIAFYSQRGTTSATRLLRTDGWFTVEAQIWVMNADGSNQHLVTPDETLALSPHFLSGGRIAFSRKTKDGVWQIASVEPDGSKFIIESETSTHSYWQPVPGPTAGTIVVYGSSTQGVPQGVTPPTTVPDGGFLASGAPFRQKLLDREIDIYPVRRFSVALHPRQDLILVRSPFSHDLVLSHIDGSEERKLPIPNKDKNIATDASWSRDGEWLAFAWGDAGAPGERPERHSEIWKMRSDGSELQNLTPDANGNNSHPSFSGDGSRIVFRSGREGRFDIYLMNSDGSGIRNLTNDAANDLFPVFSPVTNEIAFLSNRQAPQSNLYEIFLLAIDKDGTASQVRQLTHDGAQKGHIAYSYDGRWLIFSSEQDGTSDEEPLVQSVAFAGQMYGEMYAYRITDGKMIRLTHNKWEEGIPAWQPGLKHDERRVESDRKTEHTSVPDSSHLH